MPAGPQLSNHTELTMVVDGQLGGGRPQQRHVLLRTLVHRRQYEAAHRTYAVSTDTTNGVFLIWAEDVVVFETNYKLIVTQRGDMKYSGFSLKPTTVGRGSGDDWNLGGGFRLEDAMLSFTGI